MYFYLDILNNILDGYDNQAVMASTQKDLITVLQNPELPFSEVSAILATLSGRIPAKLEESIRAAIDLAKGKEEGAEFPAHRIKKAIDHFMEDHVRAQDRAMSRTQLEPLLAAVERYLGGLKAHETNVIAELLALYEETEKLFGGSIEVRVLTPREQNKDSLDKVVSLVLSHIMAHRKGRLVMAILEHVKNSGLTVTDPNSRLYQVLQGLAALEAK